GEGRVSASYHALMARTMAERGFDHPIWELNDKERPPPSRPLPAQSRRGPADGAVGDLARLGPEGAAPVPPHRGTGARAPRGAGTCRPGLNCCSENENPDERTRYPGRRARQAPRLRRAEPPRLRLDVVAQARGDPH